MKKVNFLYVVLCTIILISCNKNQKVVKDLTGTWKISSLTVDGTAAPAAFFENITYTFNECKVKKGDCDGTVKMGSDSTPFTYNVTEKGEKFSITQTQGNTTTTTSGDILEHSDSKVVFQWDDDGKTYVYTFTK